MRVKPLILFTLLAVILGLTVCGPGTALSIPAGATISLVPFASEVYGFRGVVPRGWVEYWPKVFLRGMPLTDPTILYLQRIPNATSEQIAPLAANLFGLEVFPERSDIVTTEAFNWGLHGFESNAFPTMAFNQTDVDLLTADLAVAESDGDLYIVLMATTPGEHDLLYDAVFMPVLEALAPVDLVQGPGDPVVGVVPERDYWPTDGWRTSTPEDRGMDSAKLTEMVSYIEENQVPIHSVSVVRHGYLVLDAKFAGYEPLPVIHSCTKSITSLLVGMAIDQGYIEGVDQAVVSFFPGREIANLDARKEAMTLEHLLTMNAGLGWKEQYVSYFSPDNTLFQMVTQAGLVEQAGDWVQFVLDRPMVAEPGTQFNYNSGVSYLLSAIVSETTGRNASAFAQEHLFGPLGIADVRWPTVQQGEPGVTIGWGQLQMSPHDMAKIGYLYLNEGRWDGQQIVSAEWVRASTTPHSLTDESGVLYGYQWWIVPWRGYYAARGLNGQYIMVIPGQDMVVAFTSDLSPGEAVWVPEMLLMFYILPAVELTPVPAN